MSETGEPPPTSTVLTEVGPRLRRLRTERGITLVALSESTGISTSTLSRLESGGRKPTLELLLPIAQAHQVPLDELVGAPEVGDPRVRLSPRTVGDRTVVPLTRAPGPMQAYKMILPPGEGPPEQRTHEGYDWIYVLSGRVRLRLGEHDLTLKPGEVAEFDTRVPHGFFADGGRSAEVLALFGRQGERMHVRAQPKRKRAAGDG